MRNKTLFPKRIYIQSVRTTLNGRIGLDRSSRRGPGRRSPNAGIVHQTPACERVQKAGKRCTTATSHGRDERLRALNFLRAIDQLLLSPARLSTLQLTISWQNVEGKFHCWWRRCENVTLWAINKEVWLRLGEPFFTGRFVLLHPAAFVSFVLAVIRLFIIHVTKNVLIHFDTFTSEITASLLPQSASICL